MTTVNFHGVKKIELHRNEINPTLTCITITITDKHQINEVTAFIDGQTHVSLDYDSGLSCEDTSAKLCPYCNEEGGTVNLAGEMWHKHCHNQFHEEVELMQTSHENRALTTIQELFSKNGKGM